MFAAIPRPPPKIQPRKPARTDENSPELTETDTKPLFFSRDSRIVRKFTRGKNTTYRLSRQDCRTLMACGQSWVPTSC
jgi:hypothetical protein